MIIITGGMILIGIFSFIFFIQDRSPNLLLSIAPPLQSNLDFEDFVELGLIRESDTQREFAVIIQNSSEEEIISGNLYLLEYFVDGEWNSIPREVEFTEVGIPIAAQSHRILNVNLTTDYPNDFSGLFRIRTPIHSDGDSMSSHDLTVEFVLE